MDLVPFDNNAALPANIADLFGSPTANDLVGGLGGGGFPVISIKGKVFHIIRGDERTLITKPGEEDTPASSIEVVIVKANPNRSKVFYATGYTEGSDSKPTCYSLDGVAPAADAQEPQSTRCATCAHNQWGSRISDNGSKGKACADSRRLAVASVDAPADVMLLRVPAASIKALQEYGKLLATRGVRPEMVVTRIGFDYSVSHPLLTFRPVALIRDREVLQQIKAAAQSETAADIVGEAAVLNESELVAESAIKVLTAAPQAEVKAEVEPAAKPAVKPAAKPAAKPATTKPAAAEAVEEPPKPAAKTEAVVASLQSQVADMLKGMDFDE